jgi:hypothetical protein
MLRGYQRRVIFLKNTDSELFEEAYFLLRDGSSQKKDGRELIDEALRIIDKKTGGNKRRRKGDRLAQLLRLIIPFLIGALTGGAILFFVLS